VIDRDIETAFNICVCICSQDGVVSSQEEAAVVDKFKSIFNLEDSNLDDLFDRFFSSKNHIDTYLDKITDVDLQKKIVDISEFSASTDGLDIRENIALQRAKIAWGIS
jgi:hypothetical protein